MAEIPIVLCFNRHVLLGAGVTILTLLDAAHEDTTYEINILNPGFSKRIKRNLRALIDSSRHSMRFFEVPSSRFAGAPKERNVWRHNKWTEIVYYRLLTSEVITDRDKVIYSDIDVFFKKDMTDAYATDLTNFEWAGVAAETHRTDYIMHAYFPENTNERVFFSGFMVMNLALMRENQAIPRYFETIIRIGDRLQLFDLDVLNISTPRIRGLPFSYVVLEDVYEANDVTQSADYCYLKTVYSVAELESARDDPHIIHYAGGRGKPWQRQQMPGYYRAVVNRLPRSLRPFKLRSFQLAWLSRRAYRKFSVRSEALPAQSNSHHGSESMNRGHG